MVRFGLSGFYGCSIGTFVKPCPLTHYGFGRCFYHLLQCEDPFCIGEEDTKRSLKTPETFGR